MEIRKIWRRLNWSLAMNRKYIVSALLLLFFINIRTNAQTNSERVPSLTLYGAGYINVYEYSGHTLNNALTIFLSKSSWVEIEKGWKIAVIATPRPHIQNNRKFPVNNISFEPNHTEGQANNPGPLPTIEEIGIPYNNTLRDNSEVFIIPSANVKLLNEDPNGWNPYFNLQIKFDVKVHGGLYLKDYRTTTGVAYVIDLKFLLYDTNNHLLKTANSSLSVHVSGLTDPEPSEDTYSIQISGAAREGALEVKTIEDYANGVSTTYEDGLIVEATKGYQVSVKSAQPAFTSASGREVPLNTVNVALHPRQNGTTTFQKALSDTGQQVAAGSATGDETHKFDIRYSIAPNNNQLLNFKPDTYSTVLQYTLTPQ